METKDIWVQRFKEWDESGLKRAEYCRQNNFPVSTFDYWRHRINKESEKANEDSLVKLSSGYSKGSVQFTLYRISFRSQHPHSRKLQFRYAAAPGFRP